MKMILRVLVGSRAHGLAGPDSDYDYRGVFVRPTSELLSIGAKPYLTQWTEADKAKGEKLDDTAWEVGHFLQLATHCNPTILEVFAAPRVDEGPAWSSWGTDLRALFPYIWHPRGVRDAFLGYGLNQRKKFLDDKDQRGTKYAVAYLRVLFQAFVLLNVGTLPVDMTVSPIYDTLRKWRAGEYTKGDVINETEMWARRVELVFAGCKQEPDLVKVNDFLLDLRKRHW